jgi:putative colanic acid biosynthesis acetyltransferase WcaF
MNDHVVYQDLSHFHLPPKFRGRSAVIVQIWWLVQSTLFGLSPQALYGWRRFLLRLFGATIGQGVLIRPSARVTYPWKISIGDHSWIGDDVVLYSLSEITIGRDAVISQRSYVCAAGHDYTHRSFDMVPGPIKIDDQVWVAADVFISPGITIGRGCVVGARSTVLSDLPAGMICVGTPAKPIRPRPSGA